MQCKLWVEEDYLATTRLFANNNVQYYGMDIDYKNNLTEGENNTFAGYIGGMNGNFLLQDMAVYVDVAPGDSLRLGIRADGRQSDGTMHLEQKNGWFKVDYFRINKLSPYYDLNGDGKISTADIQMIINEMKKSADVQNIDYDLNDDGKISTADIQMIINEMKK